MAGSPPSKNQTEVEIKLALASRVDHERLVAALGTARARWIQTNTFFETPERALAAARVVLRLRQETTDPPDGRRLLWLTLKHGGRVQGDVHTRGEVECALPAEVLARVQAGPSSLLGLDVPPVQALREAVPGIAALISLGGFENQRDVFDVALPADGSGVEIEMTWEVDVTQFPGKRTEYELEVELSGATPSGEVSRAVRRRLDALGVSYEPQPASKYRRFQTYREASR